MVTIKSKREIEQMKEACKLTARVHEVLKEAIRPGISTYELDQIAEKFIRSNGGIPSEKNYPSGIPGVPDFPGSICASINDEVVAHSTSSWMVYNIKTNSIDRCSAFENLEFHEQFFKERVKRLPHLKKDALEFYKNVEVTYSMIDHNKHMNNTHYFDFFLDAFAPEKPIQIAQIEYLNQAYLGNIIELFKYKDGEFDELYGFIGENPIFHLRVKYF